MSCRQATRSAVDFVGALAVDDFGDFLCKAERMDRNAGFYVHFPHARVDVEAVGASRHGQVCIAGSLVAQHQSDNPGTRFDVVKDDPCGRSGIGGYASAGPFIR